jgi:dTDP-4-dehydrorhamnose 3,5-epimerase
LAENPQALMEILKEPIHGLKLIKPKVFGDHRGYFFESFSKRVFDELGIKDQFVQDNESLSAEVGVLRGLHFQKPPHAQAKLIRVIRGKVLDVVVDIRKESPTYGQHFSVELSEENKLMLFVPKGFAHGFVTLEANTLFSYKCSDFYFPELEETLMWNDPQLSINWGVNTPILSEKDQQGTLFNDFSSLF